MFQKNFVKKPKKILTLIYQSVILSERVCEGMGVLCDEAGDCSRSEVTSVEYVRCRKRHVIGRLELFRTKRISQGKKETGLCRLIFCPWSDTHG